eukprot:542724_1
MANDGEYLIFGYIRNLKSDKVIKQIHIPNVIKTLCGLFIGSIQREDYFEQYGTQMKIDSYNKRISKNIKKYIHNNMYQKGTWNTAYGEFTIDPILNKLYIWQFYIQNKKGSICIGIDEYDSLKLNHDFSGNSRTKNYSYCGGNGKIYSQKSSKPWGPRFKRDDYVYMKLDFSTNSANGILSYCVASLSSNELMCADSQNYKVAFNNVSVDKQYKIAVSIGTTIGDCCVELVACCNFWKN